MAANKYIALVSGKLKEIFASVTSTANAIVAMDSSGRIDVSVLPVGVSAEVVVVPSSENLAAGDFVNLYPNAGTTNARKADATNNTKPAHGFVLAGVTSPANATVYLVGNINTAVTGLTPGTDYYLSTTPGTVTITPPAAAGNIVEFLGRATIAGALPMMNASTIEVA